MNLKTIKARSALAGLVALLAVGLITFASINAQRATAELTAAYHTRELSLQLASEHRQTSEALTRYARTYVVTADPFYEEQYNRVLDISVGKAPRPLEYERLYWSFYDGARQPPRAAGEPAVLLDMMKHAGFTDAEFALLARSKDLSNDLVKLEVQAMAAVKGLYADAEGKYTVTGAPDMTLARNLLHSAEYHQYIAGIMQPIDEFNVALAARTNGEIALASANAATAQAILFASVGFVVLVIVAFGIYLARSVVAPMSRLTASMTHLSEGKLDTEVGFIRRSDELGEMARAVEVFKQNGIKVAALSKDEAARAEEALERARMMQRFQGEFDTVIAATVEGDFSRRIETRFADADIDRISENFNNMLATVSSTIDEAGRVLAALAQTDLTQRMEGNYRGIFASLQADTNAVSEKLTELVTRLRSTSRSLRSATGEILAGANDLAERTTKQAAAIEETSAAMEQLATTVTQNARKAEAASVRTASAARLATEGGEVMTQATDAMERITASSGKISNIIGLIDDIAFQTNLLALNASVEAARAGEAGKGFAVVAVEVRRLAQSAAQASTDVKSLIEQSTNEVNGGSRLVASAASKLQAISEAVEENSQLMKGISEASSEQSSAIAEVSTAVRQMDEMTQHNAALVEETNAAIEQTETQAQDLDTIVDIFRIESSGGLDNRGSAPLAPPAGSIARAGAGIKALQHKVKTAAKSYLSRGNAALDADWSEF